MSYDLQQYKSYFPVRYDYVKQLPTGWSLLPNIAIFEERIERGYPDEELLSVTIGRGVIKQTELDKKDSSTLDKSKYLLVYPNDLVYSMRFRQGASGYSNYKGIVSPACTVLKPRKGIKLNPRFFYYLFRTEFFKNYVERFSYGIADGQIPLRYSDFKRMYSIFPPLEFQNAIVSYLDKKNEEIESFIRKKEKLIELLEEERTLIINKATTKGIKANVNLKSSKIDWLGDVPEHWKILPLNYRYEVQLGKMLDTKRIAGTHLAPYLRNVDVQWGKININALPLMDFSKSDRRKYSLENGDLLVCEGGEVGRCAIWAGQVSECFYQKALHRVRPLKKTQDSTSFLFYLMFTASKRGLFNATGNLNTIEHLPAEKLKKHRFPFPPMEEQNQIVQFIEIQTEEIDSIITKIRKEIEVITKYQESLITNLVLGQISVPI